MGTTIANISVIWKTAQFRANCANGVYKHTASNRDTAERYLETEAGMRNLFPSFSHLSIFNRTQSLIVHCPWFSCVCVLFSATNIYQVLPKGQTQDYMLKIQRWKRHFSWTYGGWVYKGAAERSICHSDLLPILLLPNPPPWWSLIFKSTFHPCPHLEISA